MKRLDSIIFDFFHFSGTYESTLSDTVIGLMRFITHLGGSVFLLALSICTLAFLLIKKHYKTGLYWTAYIAFSFILCGCLKHFFGRDRPDNIYHLIEASSPAMPSGHAMRSTVVYIGLYILISRLSALSPIQKQWMKLFFFLPFLIGMSRITLGVHWPSDVIIGWLLGGVISCAFYYSTASAQLPILAKTLPNESSLNPIG